MQTMDVLLEWYFPRYGNCLFKKRGKRKMLHQLWTLTGMINKQDNQSVIRYIGLNRTYLLAEGILIKN